MTELLKFVQTARKTTVNKTDLKHQLLDPCPHGASSYQLTHQTTHLFPTPQSSRPSAFLETSYGGSIYTTGIGEHYKSELFPLEI